jgi:apolipoprotein N-acyltransferase
MIIRFFKSGFFLALSTAILLILSYPKFNLGFFAWFSFIPISIALYNAKTKFSAFKLGILTGFLFYSGILYWIYFTCRAGGVNPFLSILAWMGLSLVLSIEWGIFAVMAFFIPKKPLRPLTIALCWVFVEWIKLLVSQYWYWFPWFLVGYTQWQYSPIIQIASITGTLGLSFAIAFLGASIAEVIICKKPIRQSFKKPIPAISVVLFVVVFGVARLATPKTISNKKIKISVLQPNIDQYMKWDYKFVNSIEQTLKDQIKKTIPQKPELILWPESALPGWIDDEYSQAWLEKTLKGSNSFHIIGSVSERKGKFVSAYLLNSKAETVSVYDKRELVPFGEFVPYKPLLERFFGVLGKLGEFSAGNKNQNPFEINGLRVSPSVCYETIFPYLWRDGAKSPSDLFVNITNDGWYLNTAAPYQHFLVGAFRAVENGKPVVRSANTGISGWFDGYGRVVAKTKLDTAGVFTYEIPVTKNQTTFYSRHGEVFACLCLILFLILMLLSIFKRKNEKI